MKKTYKLLAFLIAPFSAFAQPTISHPENYTIGTTVRRVVCDPVPPGPGGANQTWDFSTLVPTGDTQIAWVEAPPVGTTLTDADFVLHDNDSTYMYYDTANGEINIIGMIDSSINQGTVDYSNPMMIIQHPITFNDMGTDSFYTSSNFGGFPVTGNGSASYVADGYGTLELPNGTYENVLRVMAQTIEYDTIDGFGAVNVVISSALWYIDSLATPLLRIDSIEISGLAQISTIDVQYYTPEVAVSVKNVKKANPIDATANLTGNELLLSGSFESGKKYEFSIYGVNGQKVYNDSFMGGSNEKRFNLGTDLNSGMYILTMHRVNDASSVKVLKLVKQ
jgi:hypothetical protein